MMTSVAKKEKFSFFPVTAYYPYQGHGVGELELIPADIGQEQLIHKFKKQRYWITVATTKSGSGARRPGIRERPPPRLDD